MIDNTGAIACYRLAMGLTDTPSAGSIVCFSVLAFQNKNNYDCFTIVTVKSMKTQKIQEQLKRILMM